MSGDSPIGAKFWALAKLYAPELVYHGAFRFRVRIVHADNRLTLDPVKAAWLDPITLAQQWPGLGGCEVKPQVGAECVVVFLDSDSSSPIVTQWLPARSAGGIPSETTADAIDKMRIGPSANAVRLGPLADIDTPRNVAAAGDFAGLYPIVPNPASKVFVK